MTTLRSRVLDRSRGDKGLGKGVKQGLIWADVRDQRPWDGTAPPGVVHSFAPDRKGEHIRHHWQNSSGILQADACAGLNVLYEKLPNGSSQFREAAYWAHLRRDFHNVWTSDKSQIAREALDGIGALYDIEREIAGPLVDVRLAARQKLSKPKVEAFKHLAALNRPQFAGGSKVSMDGARGKK